MFYQISVLFRYLKKIHSKNNNKYISISQVQKFMISKLKFEEWEYLAQGEMHFILYYKGESQSYNGKVLRIKKVRNQTLLQRQIDEILQKVLDQFLNNVGLIKHYLLASQKLQLQENEKQQFLKEIWTNIKDKNKSKKETAGLNLRVPIEMMDNLLNSHDFSGYTCLVEIKPKSPIYDRYQIETIDQIAKQNKISSGELTELVSSLPEWYYLQKNKRQVVNQKPHSNRIFSCAFFRGELISYVGQNQSLIQKYFHSSSEISREELPISLDELNKTINEILKKEDVLNKLLSIIHLYTKSYSRLRHYDEEDILETLKNIDNCKLVNHFVEKTLQNYKNKEFKQNKYPVDQEPVSKTSMQKLQEILQYLLSTTFRDISIFFQIKIINKQSKEGQIKINEDYFADYKLIILDYDLKSVYRTKGKYIAEDALILRKIVKMMLNGQIPDKVQSNL